MFHNVLCVIPARKGSKGVPGKNKKLLSGKPLIYYSVYHAQRDGIPDKNIVISSDDDDILAMAKEWGVIAHRRPDYFCEDMSSTEDAMIDALTYAPVNCSSILLLQPTSPIRFRNRVRRCLSIHAERWDSSSRFYGIDTVITGTKYYPFFWQRRSNYTEHPLYDPNYNPLSRPMRQEIEENRHFYFENGNIYVSDIYILDDYRCRIGRKVFVDTITELEAMQIDTNEDFRLMDIILSSTNILEEDCCSY